MTTPTPEAPMYPYTAAEQARRDIASALRGIRGIRSLPHGIKSAVVEPESEASAARFDFDPPVNLEASCRVILVTDPTTGATFIDVDTMVAELAADIERCRAELAECAVGVAA